METKILTAAVSAAAHIPTFADFLIERQNSSRVPSPGSASPGLSPLGVDLTWPSFYGNQPSTDLNKDAFLGQYIHRIYCRECREQEAMAAANQQAASSSSGSQPNSPPQYQMDQMSLATAMDANKEGESFLHTIHRHVLGLLHYYTVYIVMLSSSFVRYIFKGRFSKFMSVI